MVLLYGLARDAEYLGNTVKAKSYYSKLLGKGKIDAIDDRIIFNAANLFDHAGSKEDAVPLWREYIRRNQNYLPFYRKLADFFLAKEDGRSALPYLLFLSEKIHPNGYLLVKIICSCQAVGFYDRFVACLTNLSHHSPIKSPINCGRVW